MLRYSRHRRAHQLTDAQLVEIDDAFREFAELVAPDETPDVVTEDPDDNHFLAAAEAGKADFLVTGDPHLLNIGPYQGIPILGPADFLSRVFPE